MGPGCHFKDLEKSRINIGNPSCSRGSILISVILKKMEDLRKVSTFGGFSGLKLFLEQKGSPC